MKKRKVNLWKVIIISDVMIGILLLVILYIKYLNVKNSTQNSKIFQFNEFKYIIPNNLTLKPIDDRTFKIQGKKWYMTIEIVIDENNYNNQRGNIIYEALTKNGYNVSKPQDIIISDNLVTIFNELNKKIVICYVATKKPYLYEIFLYNNDLSYDTQALSEVMNILQNFTIEEKLKKYNYYVAEINQEESK